MLLDYDKLLDDWAEYLLKKSDEADENNSYEEIGTFKYGYRKGYAEGIREAVSYLSFLEKRRKSLYKL